MRVMLAVALVFASGIATADCTLQWDYDDTLNDWIGGFRIYQGGTQVGEAPATARSGLCADLGLVPGPEDVTATAFRGSDESLPSGPASIAVAPHALHVTVAVDPTNP